MIERRNVKRLTAVTAALLVAVAGYEGYRELAYRDAVGVPTIGFGTTHGVQMGDRLDPVRAVMRLNDDLDVFAEDIASCIGDVPLAQHEWDAFLSLAYNIGSGAFCRSTLVRKLRTLDYEGACKEILRWNKAGGKVLAGLVKRREKEYATCMGQS